MAELITPVAPIFFLFLLGCVISQGSSLGVQLDVQDDHVIMENEICLVNISNPGGNIIGIQYAGIDLLNVSEANTGGYWDVVWDIPGIPSKRKKGNFEVIQGTSFKVILETEEQVELSFTSTWNSSLINQHVPLNIDKRYIMLSNSSGFYTYAIYEHPQEFPGFHLDNTRIAFKLREDKFHYMAMSDNRQRYMPLPEDRTPPRGQPLAYPEAVRLIDPIEPEFKGEVDDKYQYSCENGDIKVHGWISTEEPAIGFWHITPSDEFRSGGPLKQSLTSHVGPTTLTVFDSTHYAGAELVPKILTGEEWKKVFGPLFIYLNSAVAEEDPLQLWDDAKNQTLIEIQNWPYNFPASDDFPKSDQRGNVTGRLLVHDRSLCDGNTSAADAYIGLAPPGEVGSWQRECKGYQFWTRTSKEGNFSIPNIRPGSYNLYAWVPGFIGDYRYDTILNITSGCDINLDDIVYEAPRDGATLWEIGYPDRLAGEFYVPDPNPDYVNKLFVNHTDRFRQYGLWERYAELYPDSDLVYTVGESNYTEDWFFAQVTRKNGTAFMGTTWQINFNLDWVDENGTYKLRVAIASAHIAELQVRVNDPKATPPIFSTGEVPIGRDNSIARHGIHGLYWLYSIDVLGTQLSEGMNTIFLTQPLNVSPFQGILYDYIRLESPSIP